MISYKASHWPSTVFNNFPHFSFVLLSANAERFSVYLVQGVFFYNSFTFVVHINVHYVVVLRELPKKNQASIWALTPPPFPKSFGTLRTLFLKSKLLEPVQQICAS